MRKNAKHILYFFLAMIVIILIRIGSFIAYDMSSFYAENNQDNLTDVILINLTEISLVVVITQSLRWSLLKYQEYVDG
jgi:membrane protein YdbS with pleckstrin-like domain